MCYGLVSSFSYNYSFNHLKFCFANCYYSFVLDACYSIYDCGLGKNQWEHYKTGGYNLYKVKRLGKEECYIVIEAKSKEEAKKYLDDLVDNNKHSGEVYEMYDYRNIIPRKKVGGITISEYKKK